LSVATVSGSPVIDATVATGSKVQTLTVWPRPSFTEPAPPCWPCACPGRSRRRRSHRSILALRRRTPRPPRAAANTTRSIVATQRATRLERVGPWRVSLVGPHLEARSTISTPSTRGIRGIRRGQFVSRSAMTRPNSAREVTPSLPYTLTRCVSTVRGLMPTPWPRRASRDHRRPGARPGLGRVRTRRTTVSSPAEPARHGALGQAVAPRSTKISCARRSASSESRRLRECRRARRAPTAHGLCRSGSIGLRAGHDCGSRRDRGLNVAIGDGDRPDLA